MGAAVELAAAIAEFEAGDHHAHLLAAPGRAIRLADVLSESHEARQVEQLRWSPMYRAALRAVAELLDVEPTEEAIAVARRAAAAGGYDGGARYVRSLLDRAGIGVRFVDDGFAFEGALMLEEHAALVGRPVRRIVRIETEGEAAVGGSWPPFGELVDRFSRRLADAQAGGAVGLKTIAAYRCGLELPPPDEAEAWVAYDRWRSSSSRRLTDAALISYAIAIAVETTERQLPLQVHVGLGDADLVAPRADPLLLQPHLDGMLRGVPVVLLHCYPFVRQAGYLASVYADVYVDLSLAVTFVRHRAPELILEALELAPASKLLYATDASRLPEFFWLATHWWRASLAGALGRLVDDGHLDLADAQEWAGLVLAGNARRLFVSENW